MIIIIVLLIITLSFPITCYDVICFVYIYCACIIVFVSCQNLQSI